MSDRPKSFPITAVRIEMDGVEIDPTGFADPGELVEFKYDLLRGHPICQCLETGEWIFVDTGKPTADTWRDRPCGHCGKGWSAAGHDGCLGTLPGVSNACCGHGLVGDAYVVLACGKRFAGEEAIAWIAEWGRGPETS